MRGEVGVFQPGSHGRGIGVRGHDLGEGKGPGQRAQGEDGGR